MNERLGLPSASTMERTAHCPGWRNLWCALGCPEERAYREEAEHGAAVAHARESGEAVFADRKVAADAARLRQLEDEVRTAWREDLSLKKADIEEQREQRYWMRTADFLPVCSAKPDCVLIARTNEGATRLLITDDKAGWKPVAEAARNWQLRTAVVCLMHELQDDHLITSARVAILDARDGVTVADYGPKEMFAAEQDIEHVCRRAAAPDAPRVPGAWCDYCPCKSHCPQAGAYAVVFAQKDIAERIAAMPIEGCAAIWRAKGTVEKVIEAAEARLKGLTEVELDSLGLRLQQGPPSRVITDPALVYERIAGHITAERFMRAVTLTLTALEKMVAEAWPEEADPSGRADALIAGAHILAPKAGQLREKKRGRRNASRTAAAA